MPLVGLFPPGLPTARMSSTGSLPSRGFDRVENEGPEQVKGVRTPAFDIRRRVADVRVVGNDSRPRP